jgi:predicted Fe-S protein YdhL (DUF1289 family)
MSGFKSLLKRMSQSKPEKEEAPWVASPCVSICALDENDVCIGCFRTGNEISGWGRMANEQKHEVIARCKKRMAGESVPCVIKG